MLFGSTRDEVFSKVTHIIALRCCLVLIAALVLVPAAAESVPPLFVKLESEVSISRRIETQTLNGLERIVEEFGDEFGVYPRRPIQVRIVDRDRFFELTRLPAWAVGGFSRGQIVIPVNALDHPRDLRATLRHEYVHAIVAQLSRGRAPGWLDEGLALVFEDANPQDFHHELRKVLTTHGHETLRPLGQGLNEADRSVACVAYTQSLLATKFLLARTGRTSLLQYFSQLDEGVPHDEAFFVSFNLRYERLKRLAHEKTAEWALAKADSLPELLN